MELDTAAVHGGSLHDPQGGVTSPLITSSAFEYLNQAEVRYPRYFNSPNQAAVGKQIAALEGGQAGKVFSSGMAAISTCFLGFLVKGDHIVLQKNLYGGTTLLCNYLLPRLGIDFSYADGTPESIAQYCRPETRLIYIETPSNPHLKLTDIREVANVARDRGITTMIDNTFASPINQRPLDLGIDISIHSATKYLGGHSDFCSGAVITSLALMEDIHKAAIVLGGSLDPRVCHLLERSIKTLGLRVQRQNQVAMALAKWLEHHPAVAKVYYPGLESHPQHELARKQMTGFGGMLAFDLAAHAIDARTFQERLKLIVPAVSLGGVETTICSPLMTSHAKLSQEEQLEQDITARLLRLSCGIEAPEDLIADLDQALS